MDNLPHLYTHNTTQLNTENIKNLKPQSHLVIQSVAGVCAYMCVCVCVCTCMSVRARMLRM